MSAVSGEIRGGNKQKKRWEEMERRQRETERKIDDG